LRHRPVQHVRDTNADDVEIGSREHLLGRGVQQRNAVLGSRFLAAGQVEVRGGHDLGSRMFQISSKVTSPDSETHHSYAQFLHVVNPAGAPESKVVGNLSKTSQASPVSSGDFGAELTHTG